MRTKRLRRTLAGVFGLCILASLNAQVTIEQNNPLTLNPPDYVGWDVNTTIPLEIRHDAGDQPIEFYTTGDGISEMWLTPTLQNFVFNGYNNLDLSGNLGVGPGFSAAIPPLTRLHLSGTPISSMVNAMPGYRDWMRTGVFSSNGNDAMYVGLLKDDPLNAPLINPAVINWSTNSVSVDPLLFIT